MKRLLTQMQDIEEMKEELDKDEYETTRQVCVKRLLLYIPLLNKRLGHMFLMQETIAQLQEFETSLNKMMTGNISLVDSIGSAQLAIQAAIRSSTSPEILNMFLKKENGALRTRLAALESDRILGRIPLDAYNSQATDIIKMLEKLGEPLSIKEQELLNRVSDYPLSSTVVSRYNEKFSF